MTAAGRQPGRTADDALSERMRASREAGRTWRQIGDDLDLHFQAVADKLPVAEVAYDYALRSAAGPAGAAFTWTCPACRQVIADRGPYPDPPRQEEGHADDCARWVARLHRWENAHLTR